MRQFLDVKDRYPDAIVFFRLGDFYEMFFEDAVLGARLLDLTLTTRDKGKDDAIPMCGVPHHAARGYVARLCELGHKVVICEQVEDARLAKGLVKREVVRVVTPGVVVDEESLEPKAAHYLAAIAAIDGAIALAYLDATTGELRATTVADRDALADELARVGPREVLIDVNEPGRSSGTQGPSASVAIDGEPGRSVGSEPGRRASRQGPNASAPIDGEHGRSAGRPANAGPVIDAALRARVTTVWTTSALPDADEARRVLGTLDGADGVPLAIAIAAAAALRYARETQPAGALPVTGLDVYRTGDAVVLDETAIANLELVETLIGRQRRGSLLDVIDETKTAPGGRCLRRWLLYPLTDVAAIRRRQDAVAWLVARPAVRDALREQLATIHDLERLAGRATLGIATPRDLGRVRDAIEKLPAIIATLSPAATATATATAARTVTGTAAATATATSSKLDSRPNVDGAPLPKQGSPAHAVLDPLPPILDGAPLSSPGLVELAARLRAALVDEPPGAIKDGDAIRTGHDATVDECRRLADGGKEEILRIEGCEREQSGIPSLKVRYNRVFGYYIEVTKSHLGKVPAHFVRKQTIATGERYVTPALAELERKVLAAEDTLATREAELVRELVDATATRAALITRTARRLAEIDALAGLADVAHRRGYRQPTVDDGRAIEIADGRHPVVEVMLGDGKFVPNDCRLVARDHDQIVLVTGPNMAGKSTYLRQVAQLVILAQIGSFVPATAATVGIVDRVFTRVGAADNLSRGDSTFMVEMKETAAILAGATARSLVVLDEVGRGTSTFDGVSIAWAIAEHLHDTVGARTLFATHYHELCALAETRPRIANRSVAVREHKGEIVFLRRVVDGGASKSYGIDVARLAGLPKPVIARARQILSQLEGGKQLGSSPQLSLLSTASPPPIDPTLASIADRLRALDLDRTTPIAALALLSELCDRVRQTPTR
jgi:DNA mismatch repair protein MutS